MSDDSPTRDEARASRPAVRTGFDPTARLGPRLLLVKALILGGLAIGGTLLARVPMVHDWLAPAGRLTPILRDLGWTAAPLFTLAAMILICVGVPRLVFCPLAGAAFGFGGGMLTSTIATLVAYLITFFIIRGRVTERPDRFKVPDQLAFLRHDPGLAGVILARLIPLPGLVTTVALSLSPVRRRTYLWGSLIGLLPEAAPLVLLGAGMIRSDAKHLVWLAAGTVALVIACYLLMRVALRRYRHT